MLGPTKISRQFLQLRKNEQPNEPLKIDRLKGAKRTNQSPVSPNRTQRDRLSVAIFAVSFREVFLDQPATTRILTGRVGDSLSLP